MPESNHAHSEPSNTFASSHSEALDSLLHESKALLRVEDPSRRPFQRLVEQHAATIKSPTTPAPSIGHRPWLEASRQETEKLMQGSTALKETNPQDYQALGAAISHIAIEAPASTQAHLYADETETDDYLLKTTRLIARRLAEYLEHEHLVQRSLEHQRISEEHRVLSLHMKHVLEDNQRLNEALREAEATIQQLQKKRRFL